MMKFWTVAFLIVALAAGHVESRRLLAQGAEAQGAAAFESPAQGRSCATVCQTPLLLAAFPTSKQPTSYACIADNLPGYQSGSGATTCVVAEGGKAVEAQDYSCLCLAPTQVQGLSKPDSTGSCTASCPMKSGLAGTPVVGSARNVCLAATEVGTTNHFGYTTPDGCAYVATGATMQTSSAFSCVCAYGGVATPAPATISTAAASTPESSLERPTVQLPTAG
jgi:hypothetical protein